ncbi:hypothetical protein FACS1894110_12470 [Spirochaetia bacterium]|nr:hypothetical protein FACS1894110_12470 [Spirochaetia bacterium]
MSDDTGEKKELLFKETSVKKIYYFMDSSKNINQLSKEEYKNSDKIVHYPIGFKGGAKYHNILKFTYVGFRKKLPVGIYKVANYGYGFTRPLKFFAKYLDEVLKIKELIIEKDIKPFYDKKKKVIGLNQNILSKMKNVLESLNGKQIKETEQLVTTELHSIFPQEIKIKIADYVSDSIFLSVERWNNSIKEFSDKDKHAIQELFDKLSLTGNFFSTNSLLKTKEIIDTEYIKSTYIEFSNLMKAKDTPGLEKKWQMFLKEKNWIFSYIFSHPIIFYKDEAYVGGKGIENKNGKFTDFLVKNKLTNNVSFLEIKTQKTRLLENKAYRGTDVFSISSELSGAVNQVLNQRDNLQKDFYQKQYNSDQEFEVFNSSCIVLIGSVSDLSIPQRHCFELYRNNSRDVEILTFDELMEKIKLFQDLIKVKKK